MASRLCSEIEKMFSAARVEKESSPRATVILCVSALTECEAKNIKNDILNSGKVYIRLLEDDILPPDCTHLLTKTDPQLIKTEKVLSALARGIPIIDIKYFKKVIRLQDPLKWKDYNYISVYDIGGKPNR